MIVRDHRHITGKYRGLAHRDCIINVKVNPKIPVVFHNLKNIWFPSYYAKIRQIQYQNKRYTK